MRKEYKGPLAVCADCGHSWPGDRGDMHSCVEVLKKELEVTDSLLNERQKILDAIPDCEDHGKCVPHALEWIEKAKTIMEGQK